MKALLTILLSSISLIAISQSTQNMDEKAPTLQVGLDGLNFSKGNLDAELIMQIIAEKQKEIALKVVQNTFLTGLSNTGGTIYTYVDNVLRTVIEERDQQIRSKKVIEASVNMVFAYSFMQYYLKSNKGKPIETTITTIAKKSFNLNCLGIDSLIESRKKDPPKYRNYKSQVESSLQDSHSKLKGLILDMVSEAVKQNPHLKDLGLFQTSYSASYNYLNTYITQDSNSNKSKVEIDSLFKDIKMQLDNVCKLIGLAYYSTNQMTFRYNTDDISLGKSFESSGSSEDPDLNLVILKLDSIIQEIIVKPATDTSIKTDIQELSICKTYLEKAKKILDANKSKYEDKAAIISDIIYTIQARFIPLLSKLNYRNPKITKTIELLIEKNEIIASTIKKLLPTIITNQEEIHPFIKLLSKVYEFDKAKTYSEYFKLISEIETFFPDDRVKDVLSKINSFVKDYTVIVKDTSGNEYIDFKVESFLVKLSNIKTYKNKIVEFLFTVGASSGFFGKELIYKGDTLNSFSFISEKIGVKIKLYDRAFWLTRNPGETYLRRKSVYTKFSAPKEPVISDYHLLFYGSGLLYNIINTGNSSVFRSPLIGTGLGITFYNSLDLNFTASVPIFSDRTLSKSFEYPLYSINFDIRIGEYFERLSKKRSDKATQKNLAKAIQ